MRFLLLLLPTLVAAESTAVEEVCKCPDLAPYTNKISKLELDLQARVNELAGEKSRNEQAYAGLQKHVKDHLSEIERLRKEMSTSVQAVETLRVEEGKLKQQYENALAQLNVAQSEMASIKTDRDSVRSQLGQMEQAVLTSRKELETLRSQTSQVAELERKYTTCQADSGLYKEQGENAVRKLSDLQYKLNTLEKKVFSKDHLNLVVSHNYKILTALATNVKNNVNRLFNADVFELAKLQILWFGEKVKPSVSQLIQLPVVKRTFQSSSNTLETYSHTVKDFINNRMDRFVASLGQADPSIKDMFPEDFTGKLIAFIYVFGILYLVMGIIGWVWEVTTYIPRTLLFGNRRKPMKKSGKPSKTDSMPTKAEASKGESAKNTNSSTTMKNRKA